MLGVVNVRSDDEVEYGVEDAALFVRAIWLYRSLPRVLK